MRQIIHQKFGKNINLRNNFLPFANTINNTKYIQNDFNRSSLPQNPKMNSTNNNENFNLNSQYEYNNNNINNNNNIYNIIQTINDNLSISDINEYQENRDDHEKRYSTNLSFS